MAENKKSFVLYCDSIPIIEKLSDERAGKLIKHIFKYCNDLNPVADDEVVDMAFEHFKAILKRDLKKYEAIVERNRGNGAKGGRPSKNQDNPVGFLETQDNPTEPKKADTDNGTVTVIVNEIKKPISIDSRKLKFAHSLKPFVDEYGKEMIRAFYEYWTEHGEMDKKFRMEKQSSFSISRRLSEWKKRETNFNKSNNGKITATDEFKQLTNSIQFNDPTI